MTHPWERPDGVKRLIRLPLVLPILLFVLLAAGGMFVIDQRAFHSQERQLLTQRAASSLESVIRNVDELRRSHETYARLLADTPALGDAVANGDAGAARGLLSKLRENQAFEEITIYRRNAAELLTLGPPKGDRLDADAFASGLAGRTSSVSVVDPAGLVVLASTPVRQGRRIVGVLVVASTVRGTDLVEYREDEAAVLQNDSLVTTSASRPGLVAVLARARLRAGMPQLNRRLAPFHLYATASSLPGGTVVALASSADLHAIAQKRRLTFALTGLLLLALVPLVIFFVRRSVTRPLRAMTAITGRMLSGDYSGRVTGSRIPELDALGRAVNHLGERAEDRARLEEELRQSQKMDAVGRLAGGVAHDFNNLLTAIIGSSDLLTMVHGDELRRADALRYVEEIRTASDRAADLTRQLLAFSRKQVLQPRVLDLNEIVCDIEKILRRLIGADVDLDVRTDAGAGPIKADPGQMEQVVLNLAVNARDAMPDGGKLTLTTERIAAEDAPLGLEQRPHVVLSVADTGSGIDEATLSRIFEPFFTTKEPGKGTGLGLATVYGIITQSGGHVRVESEPGRGSTFRIYLPEVEDALPRAERVPADLPPGGTETILLVEDEDVVRRLTGQILADAGYRVIDVGHPREAVRLLEEDASGIDLLLADVVMPELNGGEVAARAVEIRPEIKVLFMSGYTDDAVLRGGVARDDVSFLPKPFTADALRRKVRETLSCPGAELVEAG